MRPQGLRRTGTGGVIWSAPAIVLLVVVSGAPVVLASATPTGSGLAPSFSSEREFPGSGAYWEPTVAVDPSNSSYVYQAVTYINATKTCTSCEGTTVFVRTSSDGGSTWGAAHPVYAPGRKGWQYDPQLRVATDGVVYAVFLQTFDPGAMLFKSTDHGRSWQGPFTMNGNLTYNDKPILVISPSGKDVYVALNAKLAAYVAVSHDYGQRFSLVRTSNESLWWYTYGGTYAPDGNVYFAQVGEQGTKTTGKVTNQGHVDGPGKIFVLKLDRTGSVVADTFLVESDSPPSCAIPKCYGDYFSAQASVAADRAGNLVFAYTLNSQNGTAHRLYVRASTDGVTWGSPVTVNHLGDSEFPTIVSGPSAGDFRLAWQDDRHSSCWNCGGLGEWETWYARSTDGGTNWSSAFQVSNLGSGAPYKQALGYNFTDGDYFGLSVSSTGEAFLIWGEADGSSIYCCGGAWYAAGG